jgi:hypothetical protein
MCYVAAMAEDKQVEITFLSAEFSKTIITKMLDSFDAFFPIADGGYIATGHISDVDHLFGPVLHIRQDDGTGVDVRVPWRFIVATVSGPASDLKRIGFIPGA